MEPYPKRFRSENGGFGVNPKGSEHQEWRFYQQSNGGGDLECRRFNTPEGCPFGSKCRFRHVTADGRDVGAPGLSSGGRPKPCMKFFSTSGCPFGESCHFLHYVPGGLSSLGLSPVVSLPATSAAASQRKQVGPIGNQNVTINGYKTRLCNRYNSSEGCRFGDKCHFAHGESELRSPNNQSGGNLRRGQVEGPRGTGPPGFIDGSSNFSNSATFGNSSFNSEGYDEQNPTGVRVNDGSANYAAGSVCENVQVY
ncbi:hypothetical protein NE237_003367 [Protea cynaroides]|uniref:C3H1-type domain-containing protein n=1 Tax=Protea cynaroides TaxID=273540 RepID=A0A9Q0KGP3_9MAGN|nr:hypothetical protein NE237_003367 [Protea cynaroides]